MVGRSITARLLVVALMPSLILVVALGSWFVIERVRSIAEEERAYATSLLEGIALTSEFAVASGDVGLLEDIARTALPLASVFSVRFVDSAGTELVRVDDDAEYPSNALTLERDVSRTSMSDMNASSLALPPGQEADDAPKKRIGRVSFVIDPASIWTRQLDAIVKGLVASLLLLVLVGLAAWRLASSIGEPLRHLHRAIGQVARQQPPTDLPLTAHGEVGELARSVRDLSQDLDAFHRGLKESTRIATHDLQQTLELLERQNLELADARTVAERASASKSTFLANMSHEIRTPMNTIIGTLSMLRLSALDEVQRAELTLIDQSSRTLLELIDDILDISRIEAGRLELESIPTDIGVLLGEVATTFEATALEQGTVLTINIHELDVGSVVMTDPLRLKQILFNLVSNALKFTANGEVSVNVSTCPGVATDASDTPGARQWCFSVIDTGVGIPENKLDSVFKLFTQVDMSTTREYGGSGLGLYICSQLVEQMQGSISVQSTRGQGTRFSVCLPLVSTDEIPGMLAKVFPDVLPEVSTSRSIGGPVRKVQEGPWHAVDFNTSSSTRSNAMRSVSPCRFEGDSFVPSILAVDDQRINLGMLQRFFDHFGVLADFASTTSEAKYFLTAKHYDLVMTDLHMPGEDGFDLVRWLRSDASQNKDCSVLAVTADAFLSTQERALAAGFEDVLTKPVTLDIIGSAIEKWALPVAMTQVPVVSLNEPTRVSIAACAEAVCGDMEWAVGALASYRDEIPVHSAHIVQAQRQGNVQDLFQRVHALKGVSDVCRINRVSAAAEALCTAVTSNEPEQLEEILPDLIGDVLHALQEAGPACTKAIEDYKRVLS